MPYVMRKLPRLPLYKVMNKSTGRVYAKRTTRDKAEAQVRLLRAGEKK